jgi:hypothetical protein
MSLKVLFSTIGAVVFVLLAALVIYRVIDERRVSAIWRSLERNPTEGRFSEQMVAHLPETARRYFLHAIQPGTLLASSVKLSMKGSIRPSTDGKWTPIQAEQILTVPDGFVWKASLAGPMQIVGYDKYANAAGAMTWRLWGLIPVIIARGNDISKSARGRLAIESILLPSAVLPQRGVRWGAIDKETASAILTIDNEQFVLTLTLAPNGAVQKAVMDRWGNQGTTGGEYAQIPFGVHCLEEKNFSGYTIPVRFNAGWWIDADRYADFEFFQAEITEARY